MNRGQQSTLRRSRRCNPSSAGRDAAPRGGTCSGNPAGRGPGLGRAGRSAVYRRLLVGVSLLLLGALLLGGSPARAAKPTRTPKPGSGASAGPGAYEVLAAVNSVRAANGLPAFAANGALMAAAQAHSNYMASSGSASHSGAGGSDIKSRALAAGYGGGADVSVVENIYSGMNASAQTAVNWWQGDAIHLNTLLSTRHTEAGVGVAVGGAGTVYFTLDVGVVIGGAAPVGAAPAGSGGAAPAGAASSPLAPADNSVKLATALPDGSIVHPVEDGQTLWTIAALYKVDINELLRLNNLYTGSFITPGQKIIIRPPGSVPTENSALATTALDETPRPSATARPAHTLVPTLAAAALVEQSGPSAVRAALPAAVSQTAPRGSFVIWVVLGLVVSGAVLLLAGALFGRTQAD